MREHPTKLFLGRWWAMAKARGEGAPPCSFESRILMVICLVDSFWCGRCRAVRVLTVVVSPHTALKAGGRGAGIARCQQKNGFKLLKEEKEKA